MDNPFASLGEAIHKALDRLHKRADAAAGDVGDLKAELATFKIEVRSRLSEMEELGKRVSRIEGLAGHLVALDAMFAPEAVAAVTEKVSSAGPKPAPPAEPNPQPASQTIGKAPTGTLQAAEGQPAAA